MTDETQHATCMEWTDNCIGDLTTPRQKKKGLCAGCMAEIRRWAQERKRARHNSRNVDPERAEEQNRSLGDFNGGAS